MGWKSVRIDVVFCVKGCCDHATKPEGHLSHLMVGQLEVLNELVKLFVDFLVRTVMISGVLCGQVNDCVMPFLVTGSVVDFPVQGEELFGERHGTKEILAKHSRVGQTIGNSKRIPEY